VPAGLLDDAETLEVGVHLFTGSKASWETIPSDAPHFETVPKLSQLMEQLSGAKEREHANQTSWPIGVSDLGDRGRSARVLEPNLDRSLEALLLFHG
jgi:hypothetical protein